MKYKGILIRESLKDISVFNDLTIKKEEILKPENILHFQPKEWTAVHFEIENDIAILIPKLCKALKERWYINISSDDKIYILFSKKTFCYEKGNTTKRNIVREYAIRAGVPKTQIDWPE
jgi:hypothetical protein